MKWTIEEEIHLDYFVSFFVWKEGLDGTPFSWKRVSNEMKCCGFKRTPSACCHKFIRRKDKKDKEVRL